MAVLFGHALGQQGHASGRRNIPDRVLLLWHLAVQSRGKQVAQKTKQNLKQSGKQISKGKDTLPAYPPSRLVCAFF